jgi:antitoxin component YwqK of YwqJK toxin-antitoxin module
MKIKITLGLLALAISVSCYSQKLTISDLLILGKKQNWESVNTFLSSKGWEYFDSEKGDSYQLSKIVWSFNKEQYDNQAQAWFYLYTFDKVPNQIIYSVFNKPSFEIIQKSLSGAGFKLIDSEIEDNSIINTYSNSLFFLKIITEKRDDNTYSGTSITAYNFSLIKRGGFYDKDNGKRHDYYEDGTLKSEYNLKDGLIEGVINAYHANGQLRKTGNYSKGLGNGIFKEYDESGQITATYTMENGEVNGIVTIYEDNLISQEMEKQNNIKNGKFLNYYYDANNTLIMKIVGSFIQDRKNGKWESFVINNGKEELRAYTNYFNDVKDGDFMEYYGNGDTLEIGSYRKGKLNGNYTRKTRQKVYTGEGFEEISIWNTESEGQYSVGLKEGKWTNYFLDIKKEEGYYKNGLKTGTWIEYVLMSKELGEIKSTIEYVGGKKNGLTKTYYHIELSPAPIEGSIERNIINTPVFETTTYKNDLKLGDYSLKDSTGKIILKGSFYCDQMNNTWTH